ncbi:hypothetical protein D7V80_11820 [Corallococcus sp. CA054B]|uniref:hypothetical protein n=1 Tax=Corallococcus sp. CA054B TaxID=2316734 RepID=UPI000EA08494|nr:hypothetical protein [Corallococcus sp. CA054B]RKG68677.1 hypothetical protein D7V80_11820 [Corallococcus sp. CA054B]
MRRCRPRKPSPDVLRHRANRAEYFHALDVLHGRTPPEPPAPQPTDTESTSAAPGSMEFSPPPPAKNAPNGNCYCGAPLIHGKDGLICGWGLHDG